MRRLKEAGVDGEKGKKGKWEKMENQGERKGIKVEITIVEREKAEMCKKGKEVQNGVEN